MKKKKMDLFQNAEIIGVNHLQSIVGGNEEISFEKDQGDSFYRDQGDSIAEDDGDSFQRDYGDSSVNDYGDSDY